MKKNNSIGKNFPYMIHGADYNPEQWSHMPDIINEDLRLMPLAKCNAMSINIFSWTDVEKSEGEYDFSFLDSVMDRLNSIGVKVVLATPSASRPTWMAQLHPEVLRVNERREKELYGKRHNHCYTSPYYRKKVAEMNTRLAERYKNHPALLMWHVSNEYGGECHCELCQEAFRNWLKEKYHNNLDELNISYCNKFWNHTYTDWSQIESPSSLGESLSNSLSLDWKKFVTHQTRSFYKCEIAPLREITPDVPVGVNMMLEYDGLDYFKFKDDVDYISWDSYPTWHDENGLLTPVRIAFSHNLFRSIKGKPFLLMESTPSCVNWQEYNKLKRPGMHKLASLQAVAHGSDSVQYFQWRKSRGGHEKYHGAVVDHCGHENTRIFKEVTEVGSVLEKLDCIVGTYTKSEVAIIYDWENKWALDSAGAMIRNNKKYINTCISHYTPFWKNGVNVDVIDSGYDFEKYKLIVCPMLYMIKKGVAEKIEKYVKNGGNIVFTYASGWADDTDSVYLGGFPAGILKDVFGIWAEEIDTLYPDQYNIIETENGKSYKAVDHCEVIHSHGAKVLGTYTMDFYKDMPAVTCNKYGKGEAYYIAFRDTGEYVNDLYSDLIKELNINKNINNLPLGVTAQTREDDENVYLFLQNYNDTPQTVILEEKHTDIVSAEELYGEITLPEYGVFVLRKDK